MKKIYDITKYYETKAKNNLKGFYNRADQEVTEAGLNWYLNANYYAHSLSVTYGIPTAKVSDVISALSPAVEWELNKRQASEMIRGFIKGFSIDDITASTYESNKLKAWDILHDKRELENTALKTYAFAQNIQLNSEHVTIDRWMIRACFGYNRDINLTPKRYAHIERIVFDVAHELGIKGYELQTIVWEQIRREYAS